jgi:7-carboxy-7-deazaguanine synthase
MKVCEVFKSIQGEGKNQGKPSTFIRLAGCNLRCSWCDTRYAQEGGEEMTTDEIFSRVIGLRGLLVCITGGEPLLQGKELLPLLARLWEHGFSIEIETNGTIDFREFQEYASICMDVKCPSSGEASDLSLLSHLRSGDSAKFVVGDYSDCAYAEKVIRSHPVPAEIFFSPVYGSDYRIAAEFVLATDLPVRMQLQLHKILGVA